MKYCIIGAGGTGGSIGAYLTRAGKDVILIARGAHLQAMQQKGLCMETPHLGTFTVPVKAVDMEHYDEIPDILFVCVKGYSLEDVVPFIREHTDSHTIILPILNVYGTGSKLQKEIPDSLVLDGCIYITAEIKEPGCIVQKGEIFRVVYGVRNPDDLRKELFLLKDDLMSARITPLFSDCIARDTFQKFSYVAPMAACGLYYDAKAGAFQEAGEPRLLFERCMEEIDKLAEAMGIPFLVDIVKTNLAILDDISPEASTSMQRDIWAGKPSEIDDLIFEPVRMGRKYGVPMPNYEKIAAKFGWKELGNNAE